MTGPVEFRLIDGVKCYHPEVAESFESYPESGFDVTDDVEAESFWVRSRVRLLRHEVLTLSARRSARILEIGCGTGTLLRSLAGEKGLELLGSEAYLRGLRSAIHHSPGIEFIQLDATRIPFDSEFDIVGAFDVIEHIEDDEAVLRGIHRSLKPGGHLILTVPQHRFLWSRLDELVYHKRRYARRDLLEQLRRSGLDVMYVTSFVFTLFPLLLASRLLDRRSQTASDAAEFDRRVRFNPIVNRIFDRVMRIDEALIRRRWSLPCGGSLLVVARRP